jgi:replicative DNA helicase
MQNLETLEPVFFNYILDNPSYFHRIESVAFKNPEIKFIYDRVRDHFVNSKKPIVPTPQMIRQLVRIDDPQGKISDSYLQTLLSVDLTQYQQSKDDDWLRKKIQSWSTTTNLRNRLSTAIEDVRNLNPADDESVVSLVSKFKEMFGNSMLLNFDDDNLGLDFDDPLSHVQDTLKNKIPTGWKSLDELTSGGFDLKTLSIIIGPSNSGKSLWLSNIAVNATNYGKNVLYVSLEMADRKVMKRFGAISLRIPIQEYDHRSKDVKYIESKIKERKSRNAIFTKDSSLFENPMGKFFVKEFPAGSATVADVDNHIKMLQDKKGIKIDMVVVDYLTIMCPDNKQGNLFTNGKQLSEGLRAIAQKYDLAMVTAMQVGKDNFGAGDITLQDIAESKAIVETCDMMFGIIRTDAMRKENKYILKLLKMRDGGFKWERTHFELDTTYLNIINDKRFD